MKKYVIISGHKRTGTSAMMRALREAGIPIIGHKYPLLTTDRLGNTVVGGVEEALEEKIRQGNPTGYWEIDDLVTKGIKKSGRQLDGIAIKILLDGLMYCDKDVISKVILMVRNPKRVLQSIILSSDKKMPIEAEAYKIQLNIEMFILLYNYLISFDWMLKNNIRYKIVIYEELLEKPEKIIKDICKWIGRGDYKYGALAIEKELDRSKEIDIDIPIMKDFYKDCIDRNIEKLLKYDYSKVKVDLDNLYIQLIKLENK